MSIYAILASKPHNPHYLNRYFSFIESCQKVNESFEGYTEKHHICPQAKDLFPEYKSFTKHPWNCAILTPRQHFIAHWMLWKAYPETKSMIFAFFMMSHVDHNKLNSKTYSRLSEENNKNNPFLGGEIVKKRVEDGSHNFLGGEIARKTARKRVEDGSHNFLGGEIQRKRVREGTHNFLDGEYQRNVQKKRVADGTHPFLGGEIQRESTRKRVCEGTHNFLDGEAQRNRALKRVADGTHNLLGSVSCYDKRGNSIRVPKEIYHGQTGPAEDRDFVHVSSKEGKRRKQ